MFASFLLAVSSIFSSPVHFPVQLAGNFGEPRPNHFHSGVDVKTQQQEDKAIYAIGDGYVSRIVVWRRGYGKAVYITHPNGLTSVYVHLNDFSPRLRALVKRYQYAHRTFSCDFTLPASAMPVRKGQLIALSGNTGSSQGPHLHLEVHKTSTWDMMDPMDYIDLKVKDTTPPKIHGFKGFPQKGEGVINGSEESELYPSNLKEVTAWGKIGFGISANDYIEKSNNIYGVRFMRMYVDDKLLFQSDVSGISRASYRMVNSWGDYAHYLNTKKWYLKMFIEPGNTLPILKATDRGIIDISEERDYQVRFELADVFGNTTTHSMVIHGRKQSLSGKSKMTGNVFYWNQDNHYSMDGMRLEVKKSAFDNDVNFFPEMRQEADYAVSPSYRFFQKSTAVLDTVRIYIKPNHAVADPNKYFIAMLVDGPNGKLVPRYLSTGYEDGWFRTVIRDLGLRYFVSYDIEAPEIHQHSLAPDRLSFTLSDHLSGVGRFEATLDGKFILFKQGKNMVDISCNLRETPIRPNGKDRKFSLIVYDNCGNKKEFTTNIKY